MKLLQQIGLWLVTLVIASMPLWAQDSSSTQTNNAPVPAVGGVTVQDDQTMLAPPPVSGEVFPTVPTSEERSNFLRGGLTFDTAYSDNVLTGLDGKPVSDVSYSIWPTISIDQTRPRLHWSLSYAPGFTFYQRNSGRDEADHNVAINFRYRLSPHVTLSLSDGFQKSSSVFNQPDQIGATSGSVQGTDSNVVAPVADRLTNNGTAGITYQYALNSMVGASGTFSNLHYPNPAEVNANDPVQLTGIYDAASRIGTGFFSQRFNRKNYFGAVYQYQQLLSYPAGLQDTETDTQAVLLFYSYYPTEHFSLSFFGGPQYTTTEQIDAPSVTAWYPAAGMSLGWQGLHTAISASYAHSVSGGGGLIGAAETDSASLSLRHMLTRRLTFSVGANYSNRDILTVAELPNNSGHTIGGTVSLQRQLGEHLNVRAGYTRMRQVYQNVAVIAPDTNREWIGISWEFARPLGR